MVLVFVIAGNCVALAWVFDVLFALVLGDGVVFGNYGMCCFAFWGFGLGLLVSCCFSVWSGRCTALCFGLLVALMLWRVGFCGFMLVLVFGVT